MTQDNEQYRAGFEAAARRITHAEDFERDEDGYSDYVLDTYWRFWIASKREASTEPSAENRTTAKNAVVAQKDEAKDAARYRWLRAAEWDDIISTYWYNGTPIDAPRSEHLAGMDKAIDAAIAHTKQEG